MRMNLPMRLSRVLPLALTLSAPAVADVYRWVDLEGRVHYGDRRAAETAPAERRPDLSVDGYAIQSSVSAETTGAVRDRMRERLAALERTQTEIVEAARALKLAKERRELGIEPLHGERLGIAGGNSRLAPAYFERQARLAEDERLAREQLQAAHAAKNALR